MKTQAIKQKDRMSKRGKPTLVSIHKALDQLKRYREAEYEAYKIEFLFSIFIGIGNILKAKYGWRRFFIVEWWKFKLGKY